MIGTECFDNCMFFRKIYGFITFMLHISFLVLYLLENGTCSLYFVVNYNSNNNNSSNNNNNNKRNNNNNNRNKDKDKNINKTCIAKSWKTPLDYK